MKQKSPQITELNFYHRCKIKERIVDLYLSGKSFKSWSNVVCFLLLFVAPMGAIFGLDPVWGNDFSPAQVTTKLNVTFLAAIWVISFSYYKYRLRLLDYGRKLFTLR